MLLRLILAVCIWMMAMMPCVWAEEADTSSEQALSALTLAVDTYQKKDTYYIRCTFTNPTDEPINKQIDHIKFMYDPHYADRAVYEKRPTRYCESIYQYDDTVTELSVPPHRTVSLSIPVTLPQSSDKPIIIEPQHIYFYFTDSTSLATYRKSAPASAYAYPVTLYSGKPYLCIYNLSSQEAITEVKNIAIYTLCRDTLYYNHTLVDHYFNTVPIKLHIKPQEYTLLPLPSNTHKSTCTHQSHDSDVYITINDVYYSFDEYFVEWSERGETVYWGCAYYHDTKKAESSTYPLQLTASYEINGSALYAYCRVKNLQDKPFCFNTSELTFAFDYYNHNKHCFSLSSFEKCRTMIQSPYSTILYPGEEEFFTFFFFLPLDFGKMRDHYIDIKSIDYHMYGHTIPIEKKLSPLQKVLYTDLGRAALDFPKYNYKLKIEW